MRPGTDQTMSKEDVAEIMALFDADGSGSLDLFEFEKAMSMFGSFMTDQKEAFAHEQEMHHNAALSACAAPYESEIGKLFGQLDEEKAGVISPSKGTLAKDVLVFYYEGMGFEFEEEMLSAWNRAHDEGDTTGLNLDSFSRYLAELAHCDADQMSGVVDAFGDAIDYIVVKRAAKRANDIANMKANARALGSQPEGAHGPRKLKQSGSRMFARLARSGSQL